MKHPYESLFREFLKKNLKKYRKTHGLSQEKMSEKLAVTTRPYAYTEAGEGCSATTLMFYIMIMSEEEVCRFRTDFRTLLEKEGTHAFDE